MVLLLTDTVSVARRSASPADGSPASDDTVVFGLLLTTHDL